SAILTYTRVKPGTEPSAPLTGGTWYLESYVDARGEIFTPVPHSVVTLQFDGSGNFTGNAGCNSYFGPYTLGDGQSLTIGTIARTLMACSDPSIMEQENDYLLVLPEMKVYSISGNDLIMNDGTGKYTLTFSTRP
ncbi:MAG: META domain-containing protein, partial [Methanolinea sp.]|nr:META domain-containing protein [Methanolinea sp.]